MKILGLKLSWLHFLYFAWISTIAGFLGSLIYSNIMHLPICDLCWYQRIAMYPLVAIYLIGIVLKDKKCTIYAMPLILVGFLIAVYQVLLQVGIVPSVLFGCKIGVSCAEIGFKLFNIFTIPQQALAGFGSILLFNVLAMRSKD
jgi:disulfide bond formation protein DsbB